jgi:hypothetical protein
MPHQAPSELMQISSQAHGGPCLELYVQFACKGVFLPGSVGADEKRADWIGVKSEIRNSSFGCLGCEMQTEIDEFGLDPGAKCGMLAKSLSKLSVLKFEMRFFCIVTECEFPGISRPMFRTDFVRVLRSPAPSE